MSESILFDYKKKMCHGIFKPNFWKIVVPTDEGEYEVTPFIGTIKLHRVVITPGQQMLYDVSINAHRALSSATDFAKRLKEVGWLVDSSPLPMVTAFILQTRPSVPLVNAETSIALRVNNPDGELSLALDAVGGTALQPETTRGIQKAARRKVNVKDQLVLRRLLDFSFYMPWERWGRKGWALAASTIQMMHDQKRFFFTAVATGPKGRGKDQNFRMDTEYFIGNPSYSGAAVGSQFRMSAMLADCGFPKTIDEASTLNLEKYEGIVKLIGTGDRDFRGKANLSIEDITALSGFVVCANTWGSRGSPPTRKRLLVFDYSYDPDGALKERESTINTQRKWLRIKERLVPIGVPFWNWFINDINSVRGDLSGDEAIIQQVHKVEDEILECTPKLWDTTRLWPYSLMLYMLRKYGKWTTSLGIDYHIPNTQVFVTEVLNVLEAMTSEGLETDIEVLTDAIERYLAANLQQTIETLRLVRKDGQKPDEPMSADHNRISIYKGEGTLFAMETEELDQEEIVITSAFLKELKKYDDRIPALFPSLAAVTKAFGVGEAKSWKVRRQVRTEKEFIWGVKITLAHGGEPSI